MRPTKSRTRQSLFAECLESRSLLAADSAPIMDIRLEVVDATGKPTDHVQVGESFSLQAYATDLRASGGVFSAFMDVTFNEHRVESTSPLQFGSALPNVNRGSIETGRIDEAGAVAGNTAGANGGLMNVKIWQANFVARTEGEVVFAANAADRIDREALMFGIDQALDATMVQYGFARLLIGQASPSSSTNPQNPADVNADGTVSEADVDVIKKRLALAGTGSVIATKSDATFPDVDADGMISSRDLELVVESIPKAPPPPPAPEQPDNDLTTLINAGGIKLTNVRMQDSSSTINEGDLIRIDAAISFTNPVDFLQTLRKGLDTLVAFNLDTPELFKTIQSSAQYAGNFDGHVIVSVSQTLMALHVGESAIRANPTLLPSVKDPAFPSKITIQPAQDRPVFQPRAKTLPDWSSSAVKSSDYDTNGTPIARFDASHGVLEGVSSANRQRLRVELVRAPQFGQLNLQEDGAFEYTPSIELKGHDSFDIVVVSGSGTSLPQTVELAGTHPPILKVNVVFTNSQGQPITEARLGETFFAEVRASGIGQALIGSDLENLGDLGIEWKIGGVEVTEKGRANANPLFDRELLSLETDANGKLSIGNRLTTSTTEWDENMLTVRAEGLMLKQLVAQSQTVVRIPLSAQSAGNLQFEMNAIGMYGLPASLLEAESSSLQITPSALRQNTVQHFDVNDDGFVTAFDVLLGVNAINDGTAQVESRYFLDANGDGQLTPIDILLVVNYINERSSSHGEGESVSPDQVDIDQVVDARGKRALKVLANRTTD